MDAFALRNLKHFRSYNLRMEIEIRKKRVREIRKILLKRRIARIKAKKAKNLALYGTFHPHKVMLQKYLIRKAQNMVF
jgi:hypothetical protein